MTEKELRSQRAQHRTYTVLSGCVPLTPDGFKLIDIVTLKTGKVNYVYDKKEEQIKT
jgi:hypothetical protein